MQQHDTKSRVLVEHLRSAAFSTFVDPDRWDAIGPESVVDD